jgi:hypothetical protein
LNYFQIAEVQKLTENAKTALPEGITTDVLVSIAGTASKALAVSR